MIWSTSCLQDSNFAHKTLLKKLSDASIVKHPKMEYGESVEKLRKYLLFNLLLAILLLVLSTFRQSMVSDSTCRKRIPSCPEYGAIFMASNSTRKECFERKIFGLPSEYSDFVMEVKNGMLLFLFDFQERILYGVFEATSDGAMNIVPDAYKSTSNRKFPAQVRFSTFWHCDPLPENIFSDAIKENYFKQFRFNLGLSRDQVRRLLFLFEKKMVRIPSSPMRKRQHHRTSQTDKSIVKTQLKSLVNLELSTEKSQESIPEKTGNLDASDHGNTTHLEDYIPLPSIEPEEIEDLSDGFLSGADLSALWPFAKIGEKQVDDTRCHVQGWDSDSSKSASCSSGSKKNRSQVEQKKIDDSSLHVKGLYSDKTRTSAFLRLSGVGKVLGKESHRHSKVDNLGEILKGLDERNKTWKCRSRVDDASRISVFSRLRRDVGKAPEGEMKSMDVAGDFTCQNFKHESSCSVKISEKGYDKVDDLPGKQQGKALESHTTVVSSSEMKSVDIAKEFISQTLKRKIGSNDKTNDKGHHDNLQGRQPRRRLGSNCSRKRSRLTRTSNSSSSVADHSEGSSVCTINSVCREVF